MRALLLTAYEGPAALEPAEVPEPEAGDMIGIDVFAAGVGFPDLLTTWGRYQVRPEVAFTPGLEVAGTVRSAPAGSGFAPGDRVAAAVPMGGYAEVALARPERVLRIPDGLDFAAATALPINYVTAFLALRRRAALAPGEVVLVHGAGGGTGTAAVQVAKALGAKVIGTAGSPDRMRAAAEAGADHVLDSRGEWAKAVLELLGGALVAVVFDPVGGIQASRDSLRLMAPEGRYLVVGFASAEIPDFAANRLLLRNVSVVGVYLGGMLASVPGLAAEASVTLERMHREGGLRPAVNSGYRLEDAARALTELGDRSGWGKPVLAVRA